MCTVDFVQLYKHLLDINSNVTSGRSIAQQLLMKMIGLIDMPAASVDFLNCGGHLFHCSRQFRRIGLSGYRLVNSSSINGNLTRETPLERFLSPKRRNQFPNMTINGLNFVFVLPNVIDFMYLFLLASQLFLCGL